MEAQLLAEAEFLEKTIAMICENLDLEDSEFPHELRNEEFDFFQNKQLHNHLINLAQFYFTLDTADCRTPKQIEAFVYEHNEKINHDLENGSRIKSRSELERAIFGPTRTAQLREMVRIYKEPVFTVRDLSHLLDFMSARHVEPFMKALLASGLFESVKSDLTDHTMKIDTRRDPIRPVPQFYHNYGEALWKQYEKLMMGGPE